MKKKLPGKTALPETFAHAFGRRGRGRPRGSSSEASRAAALRRWSGHNIAKRELAEKGLFLVGGELHCDWCGRELSGNFHTRCHCRDEATDARG